MKLEVRNENDVTIITPVGSLVIGTPEQAMNETVARLLAEGRIRLVIDVGEVKKIDSSGIETLLIACSRTRERGGDAKLARVTPSVQRLLELAQLTSILKIYANVPDAVSSFSPERGDLPQHSSS
jgi:anti-sigma B factor antagonist